MTDFFGKFGEYLAKNLALAASILIVFFILIELVNPFNFSFIDKTKDWLGINRQTATELQEIVAGKLVGRQLLADATREYSSDFLLEKRGGVFNCAGEEQFIDDAIGTARVVVESKGLKFVEGRDKVEVIIPEAHLDQVDLKEDLQIISKRNVCTRLVQIFGGVTSESEVREKLRVEMQVYARDDEQLYNEAACNAEKEVQTLLNKSRVDQGVTYVHLTKNVKC